MSSIRRNAAFEGSNEDTHTTSTVEAAMVVATITLLCYFTTIPRQKWIGVPRPSSFNVAAAVVASSTSSEELE